jgi:cyanate permease
LAEYLKPRIGPRLTLLIGGLCLSGGLILSSLYPSLWLFLFTYGVLFGLGVGLNENIIPEELYIYYP